MKDLYIHRRIEETLLEAYKYFSVISVTGPRQSGKSTLLRHLFPQYAVYSLKDLHVRQFAQDDPVAFLSQHSEGMFIDEVQKAPVLLEYIQGIVDKDPSKRFFLSGSSNFELMRGIAESLPGRAGVYELLPMSFDEVMDSMKEKNADELMFGGFYPAIWAGKNKASLFYPSYVKTYLEKDVRDLLNVQDLMKFMKFMKLCAARVGALFNASEIGCELGADSKTVSKWLDVLQASYIITLLPPYYENITKRLVKSPKLYFTDPGLACYLLDIESSKQLSRDKMRGNIFENMIVMEVVKHRFNRGREGGVYFYRDSNQNEVDIILKQEGEITAMEVKSAMTYDSSFESSLKSLSSWIGTPVREKAVIYGGDFQNEAGGVKVVNFRNMNHLLPVIEEE